MTKKAEKWEIKDRTYLLTSGRSPLTYKIKSTGILWFDEEQGINREIRYSTNQKSLFVEDQDDNVRLEAVIFEDGVLHVPKNKPLLQQLLSVYHPKRKEWKELNPEKKAIDQVENIEAELEAMNLVHSLDIDRLEAIMRAEVGGTIANMSSKEIKRDAYLFAKKNPDLFIELANDEDVSLRNLANKAVEAGIVRLKDDNTNFVWAANGKKLFTVPFDQHPYSAFAQFFKTDEGATVMRSIEKKLDA